VHPGLVGPEACTIFGSLFKKYSKLRIKKLVTKVNFWKQKRKYNKLQIETSQNPEK
jgi:hypothetical protein